MEILSLILGPVKWVIDGLSFVYSVHSLNAEIVYETTQRQTHFGSSNATVLHRPLPFDAV